MIEDRRRPLPARKLWLYCLIFILCLGAAYVSFVAVVSICIGFRNITHHAFWVPILAGTLGLSAVLALFFRVTGRLRKLIKQENLLQF